MTLESGHLATSKSQTQSQDIVIHYCARKPPMALESGRLATSKSKTKAQGIDYQRIRVVGI